MTETLCHIEVMMILDDAYSENNRVCTCIERELMEKGIMTHFGDGLIINHKILYRLYLHTHKYLILLIYIKYL
jgi:hypothetical protein